MNSFNKRLWGLTLYQAWGIQLSVHNLHANRHTDRRADRKWKCNMISAMLENEKDWSVIITTFYWVLTVCQALCVLFCLVLTTVWNVYYHLPDFIDEETRLGEVK